MCRTKRTPFEAVEAPATGAEGMSVGCELVLEVSHLSQAWQVSVERVLSELEGAVRLERSSSVERERVSS